MGDSACALAGVRGTVTAAGVARAAGDLPAAFLTAAGDFATGFLRAAGDLAVAAWAFWLETEMLRLILRTGLEGELWTLPLPAPDAAAALASAALFSAMSSAKVFTLNAAGSFFCAFPLPAAPAFLLLPRAPAVASVSFGLATATVAAFGAGGCATATLWGCFFFLLRLVTIGALTLAAAAGSGEIVRFLRLVMMGGFTAAALLTAVLTSCALRTRARLVTIGALRASPPCWSRSRLRWVTNLGLDEAA